MLQSMGLLWIDLEDIMINEINQGKTVRSHMLNLSLFFFFFKKAIYPNS